MPRAPRLRRAAVPELSIAGLHRRVGDLGPAAQHRGPCSARGARGGRSERRGGRGEGRAAAVAVLQRLGPESGGGGGLEWILQPPFAGF